MRREDRERAKGASNRHLTFDPSPRSRHRTRRRGYAVAAFKNPRGLRACLSIAVQRRQGIFYHGVRGLKLRSAFTRGQVRVPARGGGPVLLKKVTQIWSIRFAQIPELVIGDW